MGKLDGQDSPILKFPLGHKNKTQIAIFIFIQNITNSKVNEYTFRGSNSVTFNFSSLLNESSLNPLYTGRLFHCYMLDKSICHFQGVGSTLSLFSTFDGKSC